MRWLVLLGKRITGQLNVHEDLGRTLLFEMRLIVARWVAAVSPAARRRMREIASATGLRVNFGCGTRPIEGWINVDGIENPHADILLDLRRRLPFKENSVSLVFAEHVLEHLRQTEGLRFLMECHRIMEPGARMRIIVPDAAKLMRAYVEREFALLTVAVPGPFTPVEAINQAFRQNGAHHFMYDLDQLSLALKATGFTGIEESELGRSRHPELANDERSEQRRAESLYVEAVK